MKVKTSELTGPALDWAVAKCENCTMRISGGYVFIDDYPSYAFEPHRHWGHGGPIIEREKIEIRPGINNPWLASVFDVYMFMPGETALIAAMRCYVVSKLGDEAEIPEELTL